MRIVWSTKADTEGQYEEEFQDLLHFATLEDAEMCIMRLDELYRKFKEEGRARRRGAHFWKWPAWDAAARK